MLIVTKEEFDFIKMGFARALTATVRWNEFKVFQEAFHTRDFFDLSTKDKEEIIEVQILTCVMQRMIHIEKQNPRMRMRILVRRVGKNIDDGSQIFTSEE